MPMITVQVATEAPSPDLSRRIAATVSELTASVLHKDPRVIALAVEYVAPQHWFIAGASAADLGRAAFFVDVRITDGTNTKDEKAEFVRQTYAAMDHLLGGAHEESYVHVDDVRADGYGYGGQTQERRYIASHALVDR
jgi:4-oxalocrotonate tautomerase